ncbi:hypothetical protein KDK95_34715, partial [Actinospica sp. MGRD01-02]|nr:hypothetical protein [Actinospica acidithermotolerans]
MEVLEFPDDELQPGVRAALRVSIDRLKSAEARMLRLLAIDQGVDFAAAAAAALCDLPRRQAEELLFSLEGTYLITGNDRGRWAMHDLVRAYLREALEEYADERRAARDRLLDYYAGTGATADAYLTARPGIPVPGGFACKDDALRWFDDNRANLAAAVRVSAQEGCHDIALIVSLALAEYLRQRRLFTEMVETQTSAVAAAQALGDVGLEASSMTALGVALIGARRFGEAIEVYRRAAAMYR